MHEYFACIKIHHEHECLKKPESPGTFELQTAVNHHVGTKNQTQVLRNSNHILNPWASYPIPVVCTLTKENILFTAAFKKKSVIYDRGLERQHSCLEQCTAFAEDLSAVPSTHITQLKTACNSSYKDLTPSYFMDTQTQVSTPLHRGTHMIKMNRCWSDASAVRAHTALPGELFSPQHPQSCL